MRLMIAMLLPVFAVACGDKEEDTSAEEVEEAAEDTSAEEEDSGESEDTSAEQE